MKPAKLNKYYITQGDTYSETFLFNDEDDNKIDLTLYDEIEMDIRQGADSNRTLLYSASLTSGEFSVTNVNELNVLISNTITEDWKGGTYYRDIKFTKGTTVDTYVYGEIIVREKITD